MIRTLICALVGILLVASAHAQTDHLECFRVRDSQRSAVYTTRLQGLTPPHGCVVRLPAKLMCVPTVSLATTPSPPGAPAGANTDAFLCYKVRCRGSALPRLTVADQFGKRIVRPRRSRLLCAPVPASTIGIGTPSSTTTLPGNATTSTTRTPSTVPPSTAPPSTVPPSTSPSSTSPSSTLAPPTTVTATTTTTTLVPNVGCGVANTSCGSCGNGACQPLRPNGELVCAYQTQGFCQGVCQSSADCPFGLFCVGASGDHGTCCAPCR